MVQVKDATVLLHGVVLQVEPRNKFVDGKPTNESDGANVMLSAAGGIAVMKMKQNWVESGALPAQGEMFAAIASPYAYSREQGLGNMGYTFVRHATVQDLDSIGAHLVPVGASAK